MQIETDVDQSRCYGSGGHVSDRIFYNRPSKSVTTKRCYRRCHSGIPQLSELPPFPYATGVTTSVPEHTVCFDFAEIGSPMNTVVDDVRAVVSLCNCIYKLMKKFAE